MSTESQRRFANEVLRLVPCLSGCLESVGFARQARRFASENKSDEFKHIVEFVGGVPLFRMQLPPAEWPRIAGLFKQTIWEPGERVAQQGEESHSFFLVLAGKASLIAKASDGEEYVRATLRRGDYWGEKLLTTRSQEPCLNPFSIVAHGDTELVTLSFTREDFEKLSLASKIKFPRRPAIYEGQFVDAWVPPQFKDRWVQLGQAEDGTLWPADSLPTEDDKAFVRSALLASENLRAMADLSEDAVHKLAEGATRRTVKKGELLTNGGKVVKELFVVGQGSFEIIPHIFTGPNSAKSAEAAMQAGEASHMLVVRKQQFLNDLCTSSTDLQSLAARCEEDEQRGLPHVTSSETNFDNRHSSTEDMQSSRSGRRHRTVAASFGRKFSDSPAMTKSVSGKQLANKAQVKREGVYSKDGHRLRVGDHVTHVDNGAPCYGVVGRVAQLPTKTGVAALSQRLVVEFPPPFGKQPVPPECLSLVDHMEDLEAVGSLGRGATLGEMAMLFNSRNVFTARATEDALVFCIARRRFKECLRPFANSNQKFMSYVELLREVSLLSPLLESERVELARNIAGQVTFSPGRQVIQQDTDESHALWYVVESGSCTISRDVRSPRGSVVKQEVHLTRGGHFGEAGVGDTACVEYCIDVGPEGMTCIRMDLQMIRSLRLYMDVLPSSDSASRSDLMVNRLPTAKFDVTEEVELAKLTTVTKLGEGGFGSVFLLEDAKSGKEYALKRLSKQFIQQAEVQEQVRSERDILSFLDCPFIVHFYCSYTDRSSVYMLMEAAAGGNLYELICDHPEVIFADLAPGTAAMFYIACIASALGYLHERHIAYRDLKLENVLLNCQGYAKLCDLGFARFVMGKTHTFLGTPDYMAPEIIDPPHQHGKAVDWWALGVLSFELLCGRTPWDYEEGDGNPMWTLRAIRQCHTKGPCLQKMHCESGLSKDFVRQLLAVNLKRRLGSVADLEDIKSHKWFTSAQFDFKTLASGRMVSPWKPCGGNCGGKPVVDLRHIAMRPFRQSVRVDDLHQGLNLQEASDD